MAYELLTGERLFDGETVSHTLADVLRKEIDLTKLPAETPAAIVELLRRCLDRNLKNRLSYITEARIAIDQPSAPPAAPAKSSFWPWVAAALALTSAAFAFLYFNARKPQPPPLRTFSFAPQGFPADSVNHRAAISPDGRSVAYVAEGKLWLRSLDSESARVLAGTDGAYGPFWSPDSEQIGFTVPGELKKVDRSGGLPLLLAKVPDVFSGGSWSADGRTILFSVRRQGLLEIPSGGGTPKTVAAPPAKGDFFSPSYLPTAGGRRWVLASRAGSAGGGRREDQSVVLIELGVGERRVLRETGAHPVWSPQGYVLYQTNGNQAGFWALPFSPDDGGQTGEPIPLSQIGGGPSVSREGTLLWVDQAETRANQLTWRDRAGKKIGVPPIPPAGIRMVALSPDGSQVAWYATEQLDAEIWTADLTRGGRTRLTFSPGLDTFPVWSPDAKEVAFVSQRQGTSDVFVQGVQGTGEARGVVVGPGSDVPCDWSPDGSSILFFRPSAERKSTLWTVRRKTDGTFEAPVVWLQTPSLNVRGVYSPDGRNVAYASDESGAFEVYVRPVSGDGAKWQISTGGGVDPRWSRDGREIFYTRDDALLAARVGAANGTLRPESPVELFRNRAFARASRHWDAHPDGKRFLIAEDDETSPPGIHIIQNWTALLRQKR